MKLRKVIKLIELIGESKVRMSLDANGYPVSMDGEIVKN